MGQTYMEGGWDTGDEDLRLLLGLLRTNFSIQVSRKWYSPFLKLLQQYNKIARSYKNIAHHYDTDEAIFRKFLDKEMYYSCAFFRNENESLQQAQQNKAELIARKLLLKPGMRVLDVGCGWGSLAFHLATHHDVHVTGITLSNEQLRVAKKEAESRGIADKTEFLLADYREHKAQYERIVSVGMLEHVGIKHLDEYFSRINEMLIDDGTALIHTIGNKKLALPTNPWIERYIFPGGRIPTLSQTAKEIEKGQLMLTDVEVWRLHYAWTLREWLKRFQEHRSEILELKDEGFYRMWEFYMAVCDMSFEFANLVVYQCQLSKQHGVVPVTREYLHS
ncbi:MAG: cyclopropane-fatty-acyl-phospholipid synthase [Gammaproteobacteria bacterium]|nr:cyclopropane-fatty-acyl-phospholipid synthase [Gammaproteobacteria bacterium]